MLLSYIANPQLELALVMLIVPFIVNVSGVLVAALLLVFFVVVVFNLI